MWCWKKTVQKCSFRYKLHCSSIWFTFRREHWLPSALVSLLYFSRCDPNDSHACDCALDSPCVCVCARKTRGETDDITDWTIDNWKQNILIRSLFGSDKKWKAKKKNHEKITLNYIKFQAFFSLKNWFQCKIDKEKLISWASCVFLNAMERERYNIESLRFCLQFIKMYFSV